MGLEVYRKNVARVPTYTTHMIQLKRYINTDLVPPRVYILRIENGFIRCTLIHGDCQKNKMQARKHTHILKKYP